MHFVLIDYVDGGILHLSLNKLALLFLLDFQYLFLIVLYISLHSDALLLKFKVFMDYGYHLGMGSKESIIFVHLRETTLLVETFTFLLMIINQLLGIVHRRVYLLDMFGPNLLSKLFL